MKNIRDVKSYGVTANGEEAECNVVVAMPVGNHETPKVTAKVEPPNPKRKMRF